VPKISTDLVVIFQFMVSTTSAHPPTPLLPRRLTSLQLAALAPASRRSYTTTWSRWYNWCHSNNYSAKLHRAAEPQSRQLFEFACFLFNHPTTPNSGASILSKISALNWCHQAFFGYTVSLSPRHRIALGGMARTRAPASQSAPINPAILRSFYRSTIRDTNQRDHAIWGSMVLAFFFCLRASEYASTPAKTKHYIRVQDVSFTDRHGRPAANREEAQAVHLFFRSSKADQANRGCSRSLYRSGHKSCCPVLAAWSLRIIGEQMGSEAEDPFCSYPDTRGTRRQVSVAIISAAVKKAATAHGLPCAKFSSHSLRSGGATEMFLGGCSDTTVQLFGRWESDAYKAYIRIDRDRNIQISSRMMSLFNKVYHTQSHNHQFMLA
jgi:hypothetical protein